jgi:hypothetical protein
VRRQYIPSRLIGSCRPAVLFRVTRLAALVFWQKMWALGSIPFLVVLLWSLEGHRRVVDRASRCVPGVLRVGQGDDAGLGIEPISVPVVHLILFLCVCIERREQRHLCRLALGAIPGERIGSWPIFVHCVAAPSTVIGPALFQN